MTQRQTKILIKVIIGITLIFIMYCILLFIISQSKQSAKKSEISPQTLQTQEKKDSKEEEIPKKYMLKAVNNKVYSFEILDNGTLNNVEKTNIDIKYMRQIDKNSLNDGICVSTKGELLTLIEDFSS